MKAGVLVYTISIDDVVGIAQREGFGERTVIGNLSKITKSFCKQLDWEERLREAIVRALEPQPQ